MPYGALKDLCLDPAPFSHLLTERRIIMKKNILLVLLSLFLIFFINGNVFADDDDDDDDCNMEMLYSSESRIAVNELPGDANWVHIIDQPGSYYLTENIIVQSINQGAIFVSADNVTIDLNGFTIYGGSARNQGISGDTIKNFTVLNGNILGFQGVGIYAQNTDNFHAQNLRIECDPNSLTSGIRSGTNSFITNCSVKNCLSAGIDVSGNGGFISQCVTNSTGYYGIYLNGSGTVAGCVVNGNSSYGIVIKNGTGLIRGNSITNTAGIDATGSTLINNHIK